MKIELRALEVIRTWRGQKYNAEHESAAELLTLICDALREQDKITRHACVERLSKQWRNNAKYVDYMGDDLPLSEARYLAKKQDELYTSAILIQSEAEQ